MQAPVTELTSSPGYNLTKQYVHNFPTLNPDFLQNCPKEYWRLFIDGNQQNGGADEFFEGGMQNIKKPEIILYQQKINGWIPFEQREPNYTLAMSKAMAWRINQQKTYGKNAKITVQFIKTLHHIGLSNVENTHCVKKNHAPAGSFRTTQTAYFLALQYERMSGPGLQEYLEGMQKGERAFQIQLTNESIDKAFYTIGYDSHGKCLSLWQEGKEKNSNVSEIKRQIFTDLLNIKNGSTNKFCLVSVAPANNLFSLDERIQEELDIYYRQIEQSNSLKDPTENLYIKILETVKFIQLLCRLHPFSDGNTRTLVMQLLPHLLSAFGLGNCFIFEDPNRFWLLSAEECVGEVFRALVNIQNIKAGRPCALSAFSNTDRILSFLSDKEKSNYMQSLNLLIDALKPQYSQGMFLPEIRTDLFDNLDQMDSNQKSLS